MKEFALPNEKSSQAWSLDNVYYFWGDWLNGGSTKVSVDM